jgi:tetratricopeptide (TPR) repeat protein
MSNHSPLRFLGILAALAGIVLPGFLTAQVARAADDAATPESLATRELRTVVEKEKLIWAHLEGRADDLMEQRRAQAEFRAVADTYEKIIRDKPDFAEAWAAYGLLLSRLGERENAMRSFVRANKLNPNIPMVKNQMGNYLTEDGEYSEALGYYLMAIELDESQPLYHYQLGSLLAAYRDFFIDDGTFDRATIDAKMQAAFLRAAELAPDEWGYVYRYAESFYDLGKPKWEEALAEWQKLEKRAAEGMETQVVLLHEARVLAELDRADEASTILESVSEPVLQQSKQTVIEQLDQKSKE